MKVYSKLLLEDGGGIISPYQQAEHVQNEVNIFIGLGGTGIDCLREIKTQVYLRLKPDKQGMDRKEYSNIRFLGVDCEFSHNEGKYNNLCLDSSELFYISDYLFRDKQILEKLQKIPEFDWFRWNDIDIFESHGSAGIRQIGRFMMMMNAKRFSEKVKEEIYRGRSGIKSPIINIHVISGLCGGTGSGCFLDVCYMLRNIQKELGSILIFGYFFLPDVNLSRISTSDNLTRGYVIRNGYAAMQELDYCMQIKENGGEFIQEYQGLELIKWEVAPVDMCHLISATNANGYVIPNAYKYAMSVTAEYIINHLTAPSNSNSILGTISELHSVPQIINQANCFKSYGFNLKYCTLGAASAGIPLREINTYLASELFERFSTIGGNTPTKADVEALELSALAKGRKNESEVYDSLLMEIREGADDNYAPYTDDWRYVRDYGNSDLVLNYTNQTAKKLNSVVANAKSMVSENNEKSLIGRIRAALGNIICDIDKGPIFAYKMLSAFESHNLLNKIDGLIEENKNRWDQEEAQRDLRIRDYEGARSDFENRHRRKLLDNDQKRFNDYEFYLRCLEQHKLMVGIYKKLDEVLTKLIKQIEDSTAGYYIKLYRVMETLINSFKENRKALESEKTIENRDGFTIPMMTVSELKPSLDAEIENINIPNMLDAFMKLLLDNESSWMDEDESKITKLVTDFFVNEAFGNFANKTITAFLRDKYGNPTYDVLTNKIFNEWMIKLTDKAEPLFCYDNANWSEYKTAKLAYLSVPEVSAPIKSAARMMHNQDNLWQVKETDLTDRISAIVTHCALPLCSYRGYEMYERACFASSEVGRHYYEGKDVEGMRFNDWRKLSSLTPRSLVNMDMIPYQLKDIISEAEDLYVEAVDNNVFDDQNRICTPDEHDISKIQELIKECDSLAENMQNVSQLELAKEKIEELNVAPANINMVATRYSIPNDGHQDTTEDRLRRDYFISFPVCQMEVRDILKQIKGIKEEIEQVKSKLQNKIDVIEVVGANIEDYFDAIFTGVINIEGTVVSYHSNEFGKDDIILSKRDKTEYPFCTIPLYQAFINYQNIDKETKTEIANRVSNAYNVEYKKIQDTGKILKEMLGAGKLASWLEQAKSFAESDNIVYCVRCS